MNLFPATIAGLLRADALNVSRDPTLMIGIVMSLLPVPLIVIFGPLAETAAHETFGITGVARMLGALAVLMPGAMLGWVTGFMLLEDRDEAVLMALETTPVGRNGFIAYRLVVTIVLTLIVSAGIGFFVLPDLPWTTAFLMAIITAGHAVLTALFLLAFSANRVEGLALTKLINLALLAPLAALIAPPWRYLAAIMPAFWVGEMAWASPLAPLAATSIALATAALFVILLLARLRHRTD
tara:strand:+ start:1678 stop:2394 length:717 start_codon:yes stop_codon:yes gene_type:complete